MLRSVQLRLRVKYDPDSFCGVILWNIILLFVYFLISYFEGIHYTFFGWRSALIVQWLGHLVVAEKTWVRFPLGAHNDDNETISTSS